MTIKSATKFKIGIGIIVFAAIGTMSLFFYYYVRAFYIEETYQKTDLVLGHIDATIGYVQNELRPKMFHVLPKNGFVQEAMSTSFVNKGIMSRFTTMFPGYVYRRVAIDPMNPANKADGFEAYFIRMFSADPEGTLEWRGLVSKKGQEYFIHVKGVVMKDECIACHGKPSATPQSVLEVYGRDHGHNWQLGKVVGLESIAIPMDATFSRIKKAAFSVFCGGLTGMVVLFLILNCFYYIITQRPLERASSLFRSIVKGERGLDSKIELKGQDEISELTESFNHLIDHLRQSQQDLMESELKYRKIFEGSKDAIVVADPEGWVLDLNPSGMDLMDFSNASEVIGRVRIHDFFASRELLEGFLEILEGAGFVNEYETRFKRGDGVQMDVLITANRIRSETGAVASYDCVIRNITHRKKMEQQLKQADRLASIGQLAAGVAHEINNPLSVVLGYTKLIKEDATDSSFREDLEVVYKNAAICKKIVEDLLNFSRQTRIHLFESDIHEAIESAVSVVESGLSRHDISIVRDFDTQIPRLAIDEGKVRQVCMNLLINACQAMEGGGKVTVSTRLYAAQGGILITVADTGPGIPADIQDRIFDPFFTTKEPGQGTGLGLTVSYGIIQEHKGHITFETEEGKGSTFKVWLPLGVSENETIGAHC